MYSSQGGRLPKRLCCMTTCWPFGRCTYLGYIGNLIRATRGVGKIDEKSKTIWNRHSCQKSEKIIFPGSEMLSTYFQILMAFSTNSNLEQSWVYLSLLYKSCSGCGSVGRAVAFDTRSPQFDSSHWQNFIEHLFVNLFIINCYEKTKINKKRPGMAHF